MVTAFGPVHDPFDPRRISVDRQRKKFRAFLIAIDAALLLPLSSGRRRCKSYGPSVSYRTMTQKPSVAVGLRPCVGENQKTLGSREWEFFPGLIKR